MRFDGRGEPVRIPTDPALVCPYCKFDNTPLPGSSVPDACEGCGAPL